MQVVSSEVAQSRPRFSQSKSFSTRISIPKKQMADRVCEWVAYTHTHTVIQLHLNLLGGRGRPKRVGAGRGERGRGVSRSKEGGGRRGAGEGCLGLCLSNWDADPKC
jgi:hypothetical protein